MKSLKLKKNVRDFLYICLGVFVIFLSLKYISNEYNEAVNDCVRSGNSYEYCTNGLK